MFTLSQALDAIKNKPEFTARDKGSYTVIDYNLSNRETFIGETEQQTMILHNLRGTAFSNITGKIIRLGFQKFHNFGEFPETDSRLDYSNKHVITRKYDGSCIFVIDTDEGPKLGTRAGVTDIALIAEEFIDKSDASERTQYRELISYMLNVFQATPIFEFCSRKNRVVLDYPEDMLVLTCIRYMKTGTYFSYTSMCMVAEDFGLPVAERIDGDLRSNFNGFKQSVSDLENDEGVVIRFESGADSGHMLKIKSSSYCIAHRAIDSMAFDKDIIRLYLSSQLDDMIPLIPQTRADQIQKFIINFANAMQDAALVITGLFELYKDIESQKEFALKVIESPYKNFLFGLRKGYSLQDMMKEYADRKCVTNKDCTELQQFLGMK